jgi:hypothetical protein
MTAKREGKLPSLSFTSDRRFGIELEILAFDGKNRPEQGNQPAGIEKVAALIVDNVEEPVDIKGYEHTDGNIGWVVKPDSSCGMEVCTPILKGWHGLKKACNVVNAFRDNPNIRVDNRCSVHVHVEIADLEKSELATIIAWWFKCEAVFLDSVPPHRKRNRYCQFMGLQNLLEAETRLNAEDLVKRAGQVKYFSLNTNQYVRNGRKTVEFRIIEGDGCKDPYLIKNWIRLLIHFVEMARRKGMPPPLREGDPWSSVLWLDPEDVLTFLGFNNNPKEFELSPGLTQTRDWFISRMWKHMSADAITLRQVARRQLDEILARFEKEGHPIVPEEHLTPTDMKAALYAEETKA